MPARRVRNIKPGNSKRAHHNALERKRRDSIKKAFDDLRNSLPPGVVPPKASRTELLNRTFDYYNRKIAERAVKCRELKRLRKEALKLQEEVSVPEHEKINVSPEVTKMLNDLIEEAEYYEERRLKVLKKWGLSDTSVASSTNEVPGNEDDVASEDDMDSSSDKSNNEDGRSDDDDMNSGSESSNDEDEQSDDDDKNSGSENYNNQDEQSNEDVSEDDQSSGEDDDPTFEDDDASGDNASSSSENLDPEEESSDEDVDESG